MSVCTRHRTIFEEGEKCHPCEIESDPEFVAEKIEDLETENAGYADRLEKCEKERDELKAENEKLRGKLSRIAEIAWSGADVDSEAVLSIRLILTTIAKNITQEPE